MFKKNLFYYFIKDRIKLTFKILIIFLIDKLVIINFFRFFFSIYLYCVIIFNIVIYPY